MGTLEKIADKYNVSRSWLSGYGEDVHADEEVKLNFYGSVSAGNFEELQPDISTLSVPQSIFKTVDPDECFIVKVNGDRSEEHTSELQSRFDLVCRLLLEKKK